MSLRYLDVWESSLHNSSSQGTMPMEVSRERRCKPKVKSDGELHELC